MKTAPATTLPQDNKPWEQNELAERYKARKLILYHLRAAANTYREYTTNLAKHEQLLNTLNTKTRLLRGQCIADQIVKIHNNIAEREGGL